MKWAEKQGLLMKADKGMKFKDKEGLNKYREYRKQLSLEKEKLEKSKVL